MFPAVFLCSARSVDNEGHVEQLQHYLDTIYNWQERNNMLFNGKKFETALITCDHVQQVYLCRTHQAFLHKRQKSGWILRTFQSSDTQFLKFMWKSLVQGHIDYCSQLYLPHKSSELQQIENL
jgi:hypothetical protein